MVQAKQRMLIQALLFSLICSGVIALARSNGLLQSMELAAYDLGLRFRPVIKADRRIIIVDETEADLQRFGHPLSDARLSELLTRILAQSPRVIGVDKFRDLPVPPGTDTLAELARTHPNVVWIYQVGNPGAKAISPPKWAPPLQIGFNDVVADPGGIVRRALLYMNDAGTSRAAFPLLLALSYLQAEGISPRPDPEKPEHLRLGQTTIPPFEANDGAYAGADAGGYQCLMDYSGMPGHFEHVTVAEVMDGHIDAATFRDRIVIVGASAESLKDFFSTPYSRGSKEARYLSGAELHGHIVSQFVRLAFGEAELPQFLTETREYQLIVLVGACGLLAWFGTSAVTYSVMLVIGLAALAASWSVSAAHNLWLPVVPMGLAFCVTTAGVAAVRAAHEAAERTQLMSIFGRHVSPQIAAELWRRRRELIDGQGLRPHEIEATVLFADIRGYSTAAERMTAAETAMWLNEILEVMSETVMEHGGTVWQYVGDQIMAMFGAPVPSETDERRMQDARNAFACSLAMRERITAMNARWQAQQRPPVGLRIGLHTGSMVACSLGSANRLEYAVVGDAVNLASRLESLQLPEEGELPRGATRILLSAEAYARLDAKRELCEFLGAFATKGRQEKVDVYRVRQPAEDVQHG